MLYQNRSFTCPAAELKTSQIRWDLSFLSAEAFHAVYGIPPDQVTEDFIREHSQ